MIIGRLLDLFEGICLFTLMCMALVAVAGFWVAVGYGLLYWLGFVA